MVFMAMQRLFSLGMTLNSIHNSCCWPFVFVTITIKMTKITIFRKTFFFFTITDFTCIEGEDQSIWGCDSELSVCLEIWIWDKNRIINFFSRRACQKYCLDWKERKKMCKKKVTENAGLVSMKTVSPSTSSILLSFFAYFSIIRFTKMVPSFHGLRPCPLFPAFLSKNLR